MQKDIRLVLRTLKHQLGFVVPCFWYTSHPQTGAYAAILTIASFKFHSPVFWPLAILTAVTFSGITWSIMSYNSWVDRAHDRDKNQVFASEHSALVFAYWVGLSLSTAVLLAGVVWISLSIFLFCLGVWMLGLIYSHIRHWFFWQNVVVALCSASPALVSFINSGQPNRKEFLLFGALFFLILTREVYLDMKEQGIDKGYKQTLPVVIGQPCASLHLIGLTYGWTACLLLYPDWRIQILSVGSVATQFVHSKLFLQPDIARLNKRILDWVIVLLLLGVLLSQ